MAALYDILCSAQHIHYLGEMVVVDGVFDALVLEDVINCLVCNCLLGYVQLVMLGGDGL